MGYGCLFALPYFRAGKVTVNWLINTPHPPEVSAWKDKYARQKCLLSGEKDCDK